MQKVNGLIFFKKMKKREKYIFDNFYDGIKKDVDSKIR